MIGRDMTKATRIVLMAALMGGLTACNGGLFGGGGAKSTPTIGERKPVLSRIESGAVVDPALVGTPVNLPPASVNPTWAQAGRQREQIERSSGPGGKSDQGLDRADRGIDQPAPPGSRTGGRRWQIIRRGHGRRRPCLRCRDRCTPLDLPDASGQRIAFIRFRRRGYFRWGPPLCDQWRWRSGGAERG